MPTILGPIVPNSNSFAGMEDVHLAGGFRVVSTLASRDAIAASRRKAGMRVWVAETGKEYRLGDDLNTWNEVPVGTGDVPGVIRATDYGLGVGRLPAENSQALRSLFSAAEDGWTIYIPPGDYCILQGDFPSVSRTVHLRGAGNRTRLIAKQSNSLVAPNSVGTNAVFYSGTLGNNLQLFPVAPVRNMYSGDFELVFESSVEGQLAPGQWLLLRDDLTRAAWHNDPSYDAFNEEIIQIESVSGSTVILNRSVTRSYSVSRNFQVYRFNQPPPSPVIADLVLVGCRIDLSYAVMPVFKNCTAIGCDWPNYSMRHVYGGRILHCTTVAPPTKNVSGTGPAFYLHHSMHCLVYGHRALRCEGAVVRRWSVWNFIAGCEFDWCNTGLGLYFGDGQFNVVANCKFKRSQLVWGGGGHFSDSYNFSIGCQFYSPPNRAIGAGNTATDVVTASYDGRVFTTTEEHGFIPGNAFMLGGTLGSFQGGRRYFVVASTTGSGAHGRQFVPSGSLPRTPATATAVPANLTLSIEGGWETGDAVTLHCKAPPNGVYNNRIYFLRNRSGNEFYLQIRPGQSAAFDGSADTVTLSNSVGNEWNNGDAVAFVGGSLPGGLSPAPTVYHLRDKTGDNVFRLASSPGGSAIDFSGDGSGTIYAVVPVLGTTTSTIHVEGGPCLFDSTTGSGLQVYSVGEGNTFTDHEVFNAPPNVVHLFRSGGTIIRNIRVHHASDTVSGACLVTLGNCTDTVVEGCSLYLPTASATNRILHQSACFDTRVVGGHYHINNPSGPIFTGSGSPGTRLMDLDITGNVTRSGLISASMLPHVSLADRIGYPNGIRTGGQNGVTVVSDADVPSAVPGVTHHVIVYADALTQDRSVYLDDTLAVPGDWIRVVRLGGGAFFLNIRRKSDSAVLFAFSDAPQTGMVEYVWTGTQWARSA